MAIQAYTDSPTFYANTPLSATNLNTLVNNATVVESMSRRYPGVVPFARISGPWVTETWIFRGAFQYRTGMTTARFVINILTPGNMGSGNQLQILLNDTVRHSQRADIVGVPPNTSVPYPFSIDLPINTYGFTDREIVTVLVKVSYDPANTADPNDLTGLITVFDAYVFPLNTVSLPIVNPTLTAFATPGPTTPVTLNTSKLNDLSNKLDWLVDRMSIVPMNPQPCYKMVMCARYENNGGPATSELYYTKINTGNATHLRIYITYFCYHTSTRLRINVNGYIQPYTISQDTSYPTNGVIELPLSTFVNPSTGNPPAANSDLFVRIDQDFDNGTSTRADRVILSGVEVYKATETAITSVTTFTPLANSGYDTIIPSLNTYISIANAAEALINANTNVWNKAEIFRASFAVDDFQLDFFEEEYQHRKVRVGDVLWVRGRNIKLGYGTTAYKPISGDEVDIDITYDYEHTLTSNDLETKIFSLNQFEGLFPGVEYFLRGDVVYAAEFLSDV
jgi:hypothetical protein